jgi:hypothetical protein
MFTVLTVVVPVIETVFVTATVVEILPKKLATVILLVVAAPLGLVTATSNELPLRVFAAVNSVIFLVAII